MAEVPYAILLLDGILVYLQYLQDKGRTDDLFNDPCYSTFGEELNKLLKGWQPSVLPDGKTLVISCWCYFKMPNDYCVHILN